MTSRNQSASSALGRSDRELLVPEAAVRDTKSVEMLRAWIAESELHCVLNVGFGAFSNPAAWGILLADVARHVANAHLEREKKDPKVTLWNIVDAMQQELRDPTSALKGGFSESAHRGAASNMKKTKRARRESSDGRRR